MNTTTVALASVAVGLCYASILVACVEGYLVEWSKALWAMVGKLRKVGQ
jgi:hypothetical protein